MSAHLASKTLCMLAMLVPQADFNLFVSRVRDYLIPKILRNYTVWAFLLRICRGAMWGGIIVEGSTDAAKPFMGGNAWCYSVLPGLRCRTHAVCADGHSSGAEYGSMCVAHGNCATNVFFWAFPKGGAHRRCVLPAAVHYSATVHAAARCATANLRLCEKWGA
ncbi:hypothetical protein TcCL_NonESM10180 [Trypanosoma cruzi]|nr:hypothetical protein TcCL_NonESM10180 [Trypanosoma cruzi]